MYEDKFKKIPVSYLKIKGVRYLKNQAIKPIGEWEKRNLDISNENEDIGSISD